MAVSLAYNWNRLKANEKQKSTIQRIDKRIAISITEIMNIFIFLTHFLNFQRKLTSNHHDCLSNRVFFLSYFLVLVDQWWFDASEEVEPW